MFYFLYLYHNTFIDKLSSGLDLSFFSSSFYLASFNFFNNIKCLNL